ncbi:MAG: carbon-nitrogen hydrolase family protein [Mariprofundaceae bacterium]
MRASCIQMCSGMDISANLKRAAHWLGQAAEAGSDLAVLPENFAFMGGSDADKLTVAESEDQSRVLDFLAEQAALLGMAIIGGSTALKSERADKIRNSCAAFDRRGKRLGVYDKMHLFDVDIGRDSYRESAVVRPGKAPVDIHVEDYDIGLSVCYDIRFPELYRHYASRGCHALSVVAAFTMPTGKAHWQTLLRARAIENQAYVLASAQVGTHPDGRETWGHSMIIDPWGEVLAALDEGEGMVTADLSMLELESVRGQLPALKHRVLI